MRAIGTSRSSVSKASVTQSFRRVAAAVMADKPPPMLGDQLRPDSDGRFGKFGGKYVPETLIPALLELTAEYEAAMKDEAFQVRYSAITLGGRQGRAVGMTRFALDLRKYGPSRNLELFMSTLAVFNALVCPLRVAQIGLLTFAC